MIRAFDSITLDIDIEKTRKYYATMRVFAPLTQNDRNYLFAAEHVDNEDFALLRAMGINPCKVGRVSTMDAESDDGIEYEISAIIAGRAVTVLQENGQYIPGRMGSMPFCARDDKRTFYNHDGLLPKQAVEITYLQTLPWVLTEVQRKGFD